MKITVLLSSYNGEKYIKEQIESILSQDYPNVSLYVRDDGSTDSTKNILDEYQSQNKLKWYNGNNLGCALSFWNLLSNAPQSDYFAFCDQDDFWESTKLSSAINMLSQYDNNNPLLYCSNYNVVDSQLNFLSKPKPLNRKLSFGESLIFSLAPGCTFVFNNAARLKMMMYDCNDIDIHDWTAHKIIAGVGKIIYDPNAYIGYRQHGNNLIGAQNKAVRHFIFRIKRFLSPANKNIRLKTAQTLRNVFYDELSPENQQLLDDLVNYKKSFKNKQQLIKNKNIYTNSVMLNFQLKILIMLGKI